MIEVLLLIFYRRAWLYLECFVLCCQFSNEAIILLVPYANISWSSLRPFFEYQSNYCHNWLNQSNVLAKDITSEVINNWKMDDCNDCMRNGWKEGNVSLHILIDSSFSTHEAVFQKPIWPNFTFECVQCVYFKREQYSVHGSVLSDNQISRLLTFCIIPHDWL